MLHLKMIVRLWLRNGLSTAISVISLVIGLVCSTIFVLFVVGEYQTAAAIGGERVYLAERQNPFYLGSDVRTASTTPVLGYDIKERYAEIENFVTINEQSADYPDQKREKSTTKFYKVSADFPSVFAMPVVQGDLSKTLSSISQIAVTPKFFNEIYSRPPVIGDIVRVCADKGRVVTVNGVPQPIDSTITTYTVTAILDDDNLLPFKMGAIALVDNQDIVSRRDTYFDNCVSYIRVKKGASFEAFKVKALSDTLLTQMNAKLDFVAFEDVYFSTRPTERWGGSDFIIHRDPSILPIGLSIAFAVLLIATLNYVNITMTRARSRIRNIAAERIFGASKSAVSWHTVLDTTLLVLLSFGVAVMIINIVLPIFNAFMGSTVKMTDMLTPLNGCLMTVLLIVVIGLSSAYILVRTRVKGLLENLKNPLGSATKTSGIMVVVQFVISVVLVVVSVNIARQMNFVANQITGSSSIVEVTDYGSDDMPRQFIENLTSAAWVDDVSPYGLSSMGASSDGKRSYNIVNGDKLYFALYNIRLLDGRLFEDGETENNVVVNEAFVKAFEMKSGVGEDIDNNQYHIIGVVADFVYENVATAIQPLVINYSNSATVLAKGVRRLYIKVDGNGADRYADIRALYPPPGSVECKTVAEMYKNMHVQEARLGDMVTLFMVISIVLTALGLFGLSFYTVQRRVREIAIRKVHGATTRSVVRMLVWHFFRLVAIASVLAMPIAYYVSYDWLTSFVYKVDIVWWVFGAAIGVAGVVTFVTVIAQTISAASANPVKSLNGD